MFKKFKSTVISGDELKKLVILWQLRFTLKRGHPTTCPIAWPRYYYQSVRKKTKNIAKGQIAVTTFLYFEPIWVKTIDKVVQASQMAMERSYVCAQIQKKS